MTLRGRSDTLKRKVISDRLRGVMPGEVARRADGDELWTEFRRYGRMSWTGETLRYFIEGWDAAKRAR